MHDLPKSGKPHVLHIIDHLAPGGAERMVVDIANATDKSRYRVSVCLTRSDKTLAPFLDRDIHLICLERKQRFSWKAFNVLSDFCRKENVNLIHAHNGYSLMLVVFLRLIGKLSSSIGVLVHDHNGDVEIQSGLPRLYKAVLFVFQPYYVGVHPKLSQFAKTAGLNPEKIFIIRNAINITSYIQSPDKEFDPRFFIGDQKVAIGVLVSNVRPTKAIDFFIKSVASMKDKPWVVFVVGAFADPHYAQTCQELVTQWGLEKKVIFLGKRLDISSILRKADFGILASRSESGPLVLIEYLAAGLPFLSTRVGLIGNYLDQLHIPEFVNSGDSKAFANAFLRLLALSSEERQQRGEEGRKKALQYFDIQTVMPLWYEVYEKILAGKQ